MNTHVTENKVAMKLLSPKESHPLEVADGKIAKHGDRVMDFQSKTEGVLTFGLWYWTVKYDDGVENIVSDPKKLVKI